MLFENTNGGQLGLLEKDKLLEIQAITRKLFDDPDYPKFCLDENGDGTCDPLAMFSPLMVFGAQDISQMTQDQIVTAFKNFAASP